MFQQVIDEMRGMAEILIPHSVPRVSLKFEQDVLILKQRTVTVDGYDIAICFSKSDYQEYFLESLQVQSIYSPFLPFNMVCKLGRMFLGSQHLSYIEFLRNGRKVYCWTLRLKDGQPIPPDSNNEMSSYEGFEFRLLSPGSVDLF